MSRFFRLSISEHASTLELVIEVPDDLLITDQQLNRVGTTVVAGRWRQLHQSEPDPPWFPSRFEIEPIAEFESSGIQPDYRPFKYTNGVRAWITKPIPSLIFRDY